MDNTASNEPTEILEPAPAGKPRSRRGRHIALITAAVLVGGTGITAFAVGSYLSGGGTQPDDVLRSGALAFAKVDLDPAANQKIAAYQLSKKFPGLLKDNGADEFLKDTLLAGLFTDTDVSFEQDVKPWLGDRAGVAVYPAAGDSKEPRVALAIQYTDVDKMTAAMKRLDVKEDMGWATDQNYVVVSDTTSDAEAALAGGKDALADQTDYTGDVQALEGDQLAVVWADYGRLATTDAAMGALGGLGSAGLAGMPVLGAAAGGGRLAMGLHAGGNFLELQGKTFGAKGAASVARTAGTNLAGQMPADSLAAVSLTGLGAALSEAWPALKATGLGSAPIDGATKQFGLKLPDDFKALLGDETGLAVGPIASSGTTPKVTLRTRGGDAARAEALMTVLTSMFGIPAPALEKSADGFVMGTDAAAIKADVARLADDSRFKTAVPDAGNAGALLYVNLGEALKDGLAKGADAAKYQALDAVGMSVTAEQNPTVRLRLTAK